MTDKKEPLEIDATSSLEHKEDLSVEKLEAYSEEILTTVSKNVKKFREQKSFSQMQLALEIGQNGSSWLGRAELRKPNHHFNIKHIAKISKVLNTPIYKFFEEVGEK